MNRALGFSAIGALALLAATSKLANAQVRYTVTDLGTLSSGTGRGSWANAINSSGTVVGYAVAAYVGSTNTWIYHAFVWQPTAPNATTGKMTDLGTLPGGSDSYAYGVGVDGTVVGRSDAAAFCWTNGVMAGLTPLVSTSYAHAINSSGQICGWCRTPTDNDAVLWQSAGAAPADLGEGYAYAINDGSQMAGFGVVGQDSNGYDIVQAILWQNGQRIPLDALTGYPASRAYAINASGQIAGSFCDTASTSQPFCWQAGALTGLGRLGGTSAGALAINSSGQVVGSSDTVSSGQHAFSWSVAVGMVDLNSEIKSGLGWVLIEARGINDKGQIVGYGSYKKNYHAFLLTPQ